MLGSDTSSSRTRCIGHHREEVRRRTGGSVLEPHVPRGERLGHGLSCFMQPCQVVIHLFQQTLTRRADRMARWATAVTRFEKTCQLFRSESETDGVPYEQEARNGLVRVVAKAASRSRCPGQHANAFVVADEVRADAGTTRSLTDSERPSWHRPSYNLE